MYYTDNPKSMKALKKYQDIYLLKVKKETVAVCQFEADDMFWNVLYEYTEFPFSICGQKEALPNPSRTTLLIGQVLEQNNLIKEELITVLSIMYTLYKDDNALVYSFFVEASRGF